MIINVANDFSHTPGARYIKDGPYSGEAFRINFLEPNIQNEIITINLDGAIGYATAFLDEAFGVLARKFGFGYCYKRLKFISEQDPFLIQEIYMYMSDNVFSKKLAGNNYKEAGNLLKGAHYGKN